MIKKIFLITNFLLVSIRLVFAAPSTQISVPNNFSPNTVISSSQTNANNNEITTKFNAHTHTDIITVGTVTTGTWNASVIGAAYGGTGATSLAGANIILYTDTRFSIGAFTRDTTLAGGTQSITGLGFSPKAVSFLSAQSATKEVTWGFDTVTGRGNLEPLATTGNYIIGGSFSIYDYESAGPDVIYSGYVSSFDTDGFTITWAKTGSPSGTLTVEYLAFR